MSATKYNRTGFEFGELDDVSGTGWLHVAAAIRISRETAERFFLRIIAAQADCSVRRIRVLKPQSARVAFRRR
jgi:hypothetical protein